MTIKDVAKYAGVSVATVSRALNEPEKVSDETRVRVENAVRETGYQQNLFGKHLRCKKTNIILVMLTSIVNSFCAKIINSIDNEAKKHGYNIMICATNDDSKTEERYTNYLKNGFVDGMIIINSTMDKKQMASLSKKYPVVQCSEYVDQNATPFVSINNRQAGYDAVSALLGEGRKNILFIGVLNHNIISAKERFRGYKEALREKGFEIDNNKLLFSNFGFRNTYRLVTDYLNTHKDIDGVFAISDKMAAAAIVALQEKGFDVPCDVSVIGFDNTDVAYIFNPAISTVAQPHKEMGKKAFEMLLSSIKKECPENAILNHEIILRKTTNIKKGESL